jgi:hypothetical protein
VLRQSVELELNEGVRTPPERCPEGCSAPGFEGVVQFWGNGNVSRVSE